MAEQIQKTHTEQAPAEKVDTPVIPSKNVDAEKVKADIDALLDEIDEVLEESAQDFVDGFVQRGGQ